MKGSFFLKKIILRTDKRIGRFFFGDAFYCEEVIFCFFIAAYHFYFYAGTEFHLIKNVGGVINIAKRGGGKTFDPVAAVVTAGLLVFFDSLDYMFDTVLGK